MVKVMDSCHEFKPSTAKNPPCRRGGRCPLNLSRLKRPPDGGVWKFEEVGASSNVVLVTWPSFKITRSVAKSSRVAE
ncbi:hypothetical protein TNCV_403661 [Trichonephila clavipes]|nr:hypothetical protein TNCV_403661 [Trichonephila clavipes]